MRPRVLWKFATVLMISRLRSIRQSVVTKALSGRPVLVLLIGLAIFIAGALAGLAASVLFVSAPRSFVTIQEVALSVAAAIPFFLVSFYFLTGLLWEVNASSEAESTDAVNWLPISAGEYVAASSLSTAYTYSPFLFGALGFALPILFYASGPLAFLALLLAAVVSCGIGAVSVEILRSALSRASSSFNRLGGKTTVVLRLVAVSLVIILTQALFSGFLLFRILSLAGSGSNLIPILWLSLSVTSLLSGDILGFLLYLTLGVGFLALLGFIALFLRGRYWVLAPSSLQLSSYGSITVPGKLGIFRMKPISAALLRYEFRSATRRRETTRLIVLPVLIPLIMILPLLFATASPFPSSTRTSGPPPTAILGFSFFATLILFGIGLGTVVLGMSSMGREGKRIWNLCVLPITAKELARTKILFTFLIALIGLVIGGVVASFFGGLSTALFVYFAAGFGLLLAESGLGLAVGARYADFAEGPRPRFVTVAGAIIGSFAGMLVMGTVLAPILVSLILSFVFGNQSFSLIAPVLSTVVGVSIGWAGYKLSIGPIGQILSELPA